MRAIAHGAMLGVLGGGQLGGYFVLAAHKLGYRVAVLDPDPDSPAMRVADERIIAPYDQPGALERFGELCAAVTVEFESVPAASVATLERSCPASPSSEAIAILQDRAREKRFLRSIGLPLAPYAEILVASDFDRAGCYPGILKLTRQSYDGKGQALVEGRARALAAWRELGDAACVLERRLALEAEISVVLARGSDGTVRAFPIAENRHRHGILELTVAPARVSPAIGAQALAFAQRIAECLDYVGVLGVEFFVSGGELLVNEIAPRPHNSGHFTLDACGASQFEQQVRALCGLPLAEPAPTSAAAMLNLLGDAWRDGEPDWAHVLGSSGGHLHLYGKANPRPRRKMGHITVLRENAADTLEAAEGCLARLYHNAVSTRSRAA